MGTRSRWWAGSGAAASEARGARERSGPCNGVCRSRRQCLCEQSAEGVGDDRCERHGRVEQADDAGLELVGHLLLERGHHRDPLNPVADSARECDQACEHQCLRDGEPDVGAADERGRIRSEHDQAATVQQREEDPSQEDPGAPGGDERAVAGGTDVKRALRVEHLDRNHEREGHERDGFE
jgi:hypothetical protein